MSPILFETLLDEYKKELIANDSQWNTEHEGKLNLHIDVREDIKAMYIKPDLEGYDDYESAWAGPMTDYIEKEIVIPFDDKAEQLLREAEEKVVNFLLAMIDERVTKALSLPGDHSTLTLIK